MALSFNGTTLATNIDAVMFNGTAVSKVMFNGTEVWAKAVSLNWSGNSISPHYVMGIEVSGNLFRASQSPEKGTWITTQANGTFIGASSISAMSFSTSSNLVRVTMAGFSAGAWVTYTVANKAFTGTSQSGIQSTSDYYYLQTSGGLIRFRVFDGVGYDGAYISLT